MTRLRWVVLALVILVAVGSVSFQPARTFECVTPAGSPASPVYIAYSYLGSRPNFVHSDLSDSPDRWERTLRNLASMISRLISTRKGEVPLQERDPATTALTRELISHFRQFEEWAAPLNR